MTSWVVRLHHPARGADAVLTVDAADETTARETATRQAIGFVVAQATEGSNGGTT